MPPETDQPLRDDLLELATLEVLGCLDEVERARFERLFDAARPSVQAAIRDLQAEVATDPSLRASEQPSPDLRLRTLARVATAIEESERAQAPLASIGLATRQGDARASVAREIESLQRAASSAGLGGAGTGGLDSSWWTRAAIFFLLASLSVSLFFNWRYTRLSEKVLGFANSQIVDADVREAVASMGAFRFDAARHLDLGASQPGVRGHVQVYIDEASGRLAVLGVGINPDVSLVVHVYNEDAAFGGEGAGEQVTHAFRVKGTTFGEVFDVPLALVSGPAAQGLRVEIRDGSGTVVFAA